MKKVRLCIGAFLFLLLMFSSHTVLAQPFPALEQMNGKWLKMSGSVNGWAVTAFQANVVPEKFKASLNNMYACVTYDLDATAADLTIRDASGTQIGTGLLYYYGGTVDQWLAYMSLSLDSRGDYSANGADMKLYANTLAKTKNGAEKGSFKAFGMDGYIDNDAEYADLGGKLNAKIVGEVPWSGLCINFIPL